MMNEQEIQQTILENEFDGFLDKFKMFKHNKANDQEVLTNFLLYKIFKILDVQLIENRTGGEK